jgi:hypothetical protein
MLLSHPILFFMFDGRGMGESHGTRRDTTGRGREPWQPAKGRLCGSRMLHESAGLGGAAHAVERL